LVRRHPSSRDIDQGVRPRAWFVEQNRAEFHWVKNINIEMNREMSDVFVCNPIQHW